MRDKKRKRGAQPGNLNALKHGFYSDQFRTFEIEDLETLLREGLDNEIALMRVMLRRFVDMAAGFDDMEEASRTLDIVGLTATRLAQLLKVQVLLGGQTDSTLRTINEVIEEINREIALSISD